MTVWKCANMGCSNPVPEKGQKCSDCRSTNLIPDGGKFSEPGEPTCKYCGGPAERIVPEGTPYWYCENHGELDLSEVLDVEAGEIDDARDEEEER